MSGPRTVLLGATGYTGRLTARALVAAGLRPVLAARRPEPLATLAQELGGLETAIADVEQAPTVRALLERGDVLVTTVGPYARWGDVAVEAAIDAGATYLDCAAEPAFVQRVFEQHADAPVPLLPAFGWESVPGNLAAALALREAPDARSVDVGYFITGEARGWMSGGTRASFAAAALEPGFVWRNGIRSERGGARVRAFDVAGKRRPALSAPSSEHFTLPRLHSSLAEVNTYLGWFGRASRLMQVMSFGAPAIRRLPGVPHAVGALIRGSSGGPDAKTRSKTAWHAVAETFDRRGVRLAAVHLSAGNGYDFTARCLAWGAAQAAGVIERSGALGPVEAFGLERLERGCAEIGLRR